MKHVIQTYANNQNISAITAIDLAIGTLNPDPYANPGNQVRPGSIITALNVQIDWLQGGGSVSHDDSFEWYVWFNVNGAQTVPDPQNTNLSHLKNQIFHQDGAISSREFYTGVGIEIPQVSKWRLVLRVPKWAQQVNEGDKISIVFRSAVASTTSAYRITVIYKEIFP